MLTREWFSLSELAAEVLAGLPDSRSGIASYAEAKGWNDAAREGEGWRKRAGRGGGVEYHYSLLPLAAKAQVVVRYTSTASDKGAAAEQEFHREELWAWFDRQSEKKKAEAKRRLDVLQAVDAAVQGGMRKVLAVQMVGKQAQVSISKFYAWEKATHGLNRSDWLPALAPRHAGAAKAEAECAPEAWDWLKAAWLRPEQPNMADCYRQLRRVAREQGWTIPSEKTMERRLKALPETVRVFHRQGEEALKRMMPAQVRDKSTLRALEVVNLDDHRMDVFVTWPDGTIARPHLEAVQDVYSGMILGWRIDRSENSQAIRLAIGDVIEEWGIPAEFVFDNTRAAANKQITGGAPNRFRFKVKDEDPAGLIESLGARVRFTTPYHGQAKPVERAFRDAAQDWAKDMRFSGAYTGNSTTTKPSNYGSSAVPLDEFIAVIAERVEEHNTREGRRSAVCRGRSFRQAFDESYARAAESAGIVKATAEQRRMFLLQAEAVTIRREQPMIHLAGNQYFSEFMLGLRGQKVVVRFDADALHAGIHVYRLDNSYLGAAECRAAVGFSDLAQAREHARKTKQLLRAHKDVARLERTMTLQQAAALLPQIEKASLPAPETKVVRPLFGTAGNTALKPRSDELEDDLPEHQRALSNALTFAFPARPRPVED